MWQIAVHLDTTICLQNTRPWLFLGSFSDVPAPITLAGTTAYFSMPITGLRFPSEVCISFLSLKHVLIFTSSKKKSFSFLSPPSSCSAFPVQPQIQSRNFNKTLFRFWKQNGKSLILLSWVMPARGGQCTLWRRWASSYQACVPVPDVHHQGCLYLGHTCA